MARAEPEKYHFIEIMGCPGGCIGGGGQPYAGCNSIPLDTECLAARAEALYGSDRRNTIVTRTPRSRECTGSFWAGR